MTDQPALFDMPRNSQPRRPAAGRPKLFAVYTRYHNTARVLCADCCRLIHQHGQGGAPLPARARWKSVDTDGNVEFLCHDHKRSRTGD